MRPHIPDRAPDKSRPCRSPRAAIKYLADLIDDLRKILVGGRTVAKVAARLHDHGLPDWLSL